MREEKLASLAEEEVFQLARLLGLRIEFPEMDHSRNGHPDVLKYGNVAFPLQVAANDLERLERLKGLGLRGQVREHEFFRTQHIDRRRGVRLAILRIVLLFRERRL